MKESSLLLRRIHEVLYQMIGLDTYNAQHAANTKATENNDEKQEEIDRRIWINPIRNRSCVSLSRTQHRYNRT